MRYQTTDAQSATLSALLDTATENGWDAHLEPGEYGAQRLRATRGRQRVRITAVPPTVTQDAARGRRSSNGITAAYAPNSDTPWRACTLQRLQTVLQAPA